MATSVQPSTKFLFVNKDESSSSLSNSRYDKNSAINRHVQRWRSQRRREARKRAQQRPEEEQEQTEPKATPEPVLKLELDTPQLSTLSTPPLVTPSDLSAPTCESRESAEVCSASSEDIYQDSGEGESSLDNVPLMFQANFVEGDSIDPFNCTAVRLDQNVQSILQYYIAFIVPSKERNGNQSRTRRDIFNLSDNLPAVKEVVHGCLFNKTHMYALLTATSARMEEVSNVSLRRKNSARYFMNKALKHVCAYLNSKNDLSIDKQIILDVFYLCVCEWYLQNYDAALTHLKAVGHLMESLDEKSLFDQFIWETVRYNDIFLSIETATAPLFPLNWDGPTMPPERRSSISKDLNALTTYRRMGRGFTDPAQNWIFSFEMNTIVFEIVPWMDVAQYTWMFKSADKLDSEWVCSKGQALLHRLLSCIPPSFDEPKMALKRRYEECCRLMLVICLSYVTTQMAWRSSELNLARLKRSLQGVDHDWGSVALNCMLLWILLSGSFVGEGTREEQWFLDRAEPVAAGLQINTYDHLHELMSQYFYSSRLQQGTLRKLLARLGREDQALLSYTKAPPLSPDHSYRQRYGYNLAPTGGHNLCRKGHWEATSTLSCLAEFLSEDDDFVANKHLRSHSNSAVAN